jgi:L-lysine epsilon oxidase C-terminal domain
LDDPNQPDAPRQAIFRLLRDPETLMVPAPVRSSHMPRLNDDRNSGQVLPFTRLQHQALRLWSQGQFQRTDPTGDPVEFLPDAITRVALEACAGGAFFPGIEAGRIMTQAARFMAGDAFRLSPQAVRPGDITAQNAVPWQADFHQCRWEEDDAGQPKRLGWWPAQRPDDVLKNADQDPVPWARGLKDTGESMVKHWHRLGFVKRISNNPDLFLEDERDQTLDENGAV